jgi:SSS family solute:Na+ symporter
MNWIPFFIVILYIFLLFLITWSTRRLSRGGMISYLLAGRGLPYWVVAPLLTGLAIGGASTIGVAERAYNSGLAAGWYNAAWAAGAILVGLIAARRYRQMEVTTIPELFERHYNTAGRVIGVIGQLLLQIVITSLQYVAGGAILSSLLPEVFSFQSGMFVTAVVFVGITLIGGFWAAGLTNIINVILIYTGVLLGAVLAIGKVGGLGELVLKFPADYPGFDLGSLGWSLVLAWFFVMCTMTFSVQSVVQISFAAKDASSARKGFILGGLVILPVGFISALIGMAATVLHPGIIPTEALPRTVLSLSPIVAGIVLAGLWAADVSTASALHPPDFAHRFDLNHGIHVDHIGDTFLAQDLQAVSCGVDFTGCHDSFGCVAGVSRNPCIFCPGEPAPSYLFLLDSQSRHIYFGGRFR